MSIPFSVCAKPSTSFWTPIAWMYVKMSIEGKTQLNYKIMKQNVLDGVFHFHKRNNDCSILMSVPFHENPLLGFWIEDWIIDECENMKWDGGFYREKRVTWTRV